LKLGLALLLFRMLSKVAVSVATAEVSGITARKGLMTGLALTPMSAFVVLLAGQSGLAGFDLADQTLAVMAGMVMVLELVGPWVTQRALMAAGETPLTTDEREGR
jgi:Kef-type K+ transport system membrane component KefB